MRIRNNHGVPQAGTVEHSESEVAGNDEEEEEEAPSWTQKDLPGGNAGVVETPRYQSLGEG